MHMGLNFPGFVNIFNNDFGMPGQFLTTDGSGEESWSSIGTGGIWQFTEEFDIYDNVNVWNEELYLGGAAAAVSGALEMDTGAEAGGYLQIYSVYNTALTLRQAGTLTFEIRAKRNQSVPLDEGLYFGLANTFQVSDVPYYFIAFASVGSGIDRMKGTKLNGSTFADTNYWADVNNTWHTYKLVLTDASVPTAKYYVDGTLKETQNLDVLFRNLTYFAWISHSNKGIAANQDFDISYLKVKEG